MRLTFYEVADDGGETGKAIDRKLARQRPRLARGRHSGFPKAVWRLARPTRVAAFFLRKIKKCSRRVGRKRCDRKRRTELSENTAEVL